MPQVLKVKQKQKPDVRKLTPQLVKKVPDVASEKEVNNQAVA